MFRTMLKSRISGAVVTETDLAEAGSLLVDEELMQAADLVSGERVTVVDLATDARIEAHVIPAERGTGVVGLRGTQGHAARHGDAITVLSYGMMDGVESVTHQPKTVRLDRRNRILTPDGEAERATAESDQTSGAAVTAETSDAARLDALIQSEV